MQPQTPGPLQGARYGKVPPKKHRNFKRTYSEPSANLQRTQKKLTATEKLRLKYSTTPRPPPRAGTGGGGWTLTAVERPKGALRQ